MKRENNWIVSRNILQVYCSKDSIYWGLYAPPMRPLSEIFSYTLVYPVLFSSFWEKIVPSQNSKHFPHKAWNVCISKSLSMIMLESDPTDTNRKYKMYLIWPWVNSSARVNTFPLWLWCQRVVRHEDISWFPSMELLWSSEGRDWLVHPPELWSDGDRNPCNTCKKNATCCTFLSFHQFSRLTCRIPLSGQTDWNTPEACP